VQSTVGRGSIFTLYVPQAYISSAPKSESSDVPSLPAVEQQEAAGEMNLVLSPSAPSVPAEMVQETEVDDDRNLVAQGDRVLLIVEDDATFARIMVDLTHDRGAKAVVASRGDTAISLARQFQPSAITLDVRLPDMSGWTLLDQLKHDARTAHIPVHIISGHENNKRGFALGAMSCLQKDVTKESLEEIFEVIQRSMEPHKKTLLLIAESDVRKADIHSLLAGDDLEIVDAPDLGSAVQLLSSSRVDGIVLDWVLPDATGIEFIDSVQSRSALLAPPIIVSGSRPLSDQQVAELHHCARSGPVRYAPTIERLLDETVLLLHRPEASLSM